MVKKSISITRQQDSWIKGQIDTVHCGSESEVGRGLSQGRQVHERETPEEIAAIRRALIKAEESVKQKGCSKKSVDEIWEEAKAEHKAQRG